MVKKRFLFAGFDGRSTLHPHARLVDLGIEPNGISQNNKEKLTPTSASPLVITMAEARIKTVVVRIVIQHGGHLDVSL